MPLLPGANNGRQVVEVSADKLREIGVSGSAFSIHEGDQIKFDDVDTPLVVSQPIRKGSDTLAYYVACERNGNPSWVGIGVFTRRNVEGQPVGKFQEKALREPSFADIYKNLLKGKTITSVGTLTYQAAHFDAAGVRDEEKTDTRTCPNIEYVNA